MTWNETVLVSRDLLESAADELEHALAGKSQAFDTTRQMEIVAVLRSLAKDSP